MGVGEVIDTAYMTRSKIIEVASYRPIALITTTTATLLCHDSEVSTHPACIWTTTVVQ